MGRRLNAEIWEKILINRTYGRTISAIAQEFEVSNTAVTSTLAAFDAVKDEDWAKCCNLIVTYDMAVDVFEWAAQKTGKKIPEVIPQAYEKWKEDRKKRRTPAEKKPEAAPVPAPAADHWEEEKLLLGQILHELRQHNELMEQLYDVVFPKWSGDVKDNVNVNCDLINQSLKRIEDKVEAIKINFRRKGM